MKGGGKNYEQITANNFSNFMKTYKSKKLDEPWAVEHKDTMIRSFITIWWQPVIKRKILKVDRGENTLQRNKDKDDSELI